MPSESFKIKQLSHNIDYLHKQAPCGGTATELFSSTQLCPTPGSERYGRRNRLCLEALPCPTESPLAAQPSSKLQYLAINNTRPRMPSPWGDCRSDSQQSILIRPTLAAWVASGLSRRRAAKVRKVCSNIHVSYLALASGDR